MFTHPGLFTIIHIYSSCPTLTWKAKFELGFLFSLFGPLKVHHESNEQMKNLNLDVLTMPGKASVPEFDCLANSLMQCL